jgi:hypothetical protein
MKITEVLHAWASILAGRAPSLSIEITKECPLKCAGCYALDARISATQFFTEGSTSLNRS